MCLYPQLIINPKYKPNKKNGGKPPPLKDPRTKYVPIGCQKCIECKKQKARNWQVRLMEEELKNARFITLTFSNESYTSITEIIKQEATKNAIEIPNGYELENAIATKAVRYFLERWRKKHKKSLKHWLVTELGHGDTEHLHLHGIIWTTETLTNIKNIWGYGIIWIGSYVNTQTINYITKYINKADQEHPNYNSIILASPGIGKNYTTNNRDSKQNKYNGDKTIETYRTKKGYKIALPIYYRNKIYTDEEKEKLWIQKINKQERWILGNKIDISKTEEHYDKSLIYAQAKNRQLGYTDNTQWKNKKYEEQRRTMMQEKRITASKNKK